MKTAKVLVMLLAVAFLLSSQAAVAKGWGTGNRPPRDRGPGIISEEVKDKLFTEVIFELTGKEIDHETFRDAMDQKIIAEIQAAADNGTITQERAEMIMKRIQNRPSRR